MENLVEKAKKFALEKHARQMYGGKPYSYHLQGVIDNLDEYIDHFCYLVIVECAWLHDIIEDTCVSNITLAKEFSENTMKTIMLLTHYNYNTYTTYILEIKESQDRIAKIVKIADLKFNIKESESRKLNGYEKQRLEKYKLVLYILEN